MAGGKWCRVYLLAGIFLMAECVAGQTSGDSRLDIVHVGDGVQRTLDALGGIYRYQPFETDRTPATAENVVEGAVYFFKRKVGSLEASGVVTFGGGKVTAFAIAAVSPELNSGHVGRLLRELHLALGMPDRFGVVQCTNLKGPRDAPAAFWTKGDVTHAVGWIAEANGPGWIEFKSIKKGTTEDEAPLFPVNPTSPTERDAITERGMREYQGAVR
ncbi:hypothetical protein TSACC_2763 [Terrimicrobium sacchariphilum]|uniref:Uncharacterized protein n=2 Tax=Terrimicrobium sacchariphilum TaxID=690879 RepID=A0A146G3G3_TERSA|nr:hypothetical protein TSACC_2763 [Terrimicrobium sacchariphilum]